MGGMKDLMIQREGDIAWAVEFLVEAEVLERCEPHGTAFDGGVDLLDAYKILNARISSGQIPLDGKSRREMTDLLKRAYEDNCAECCYTCAKNEDE